MHAVISFNENIEKVIIIFKASSHLGIFPQIFEQVNEEPTLKLREMLRVLHTNAYTILFILFDDPDWQGGVLKLMKNDHFSVFLAVWVIFLMFLGRLSGDLC